MSLDRRVVTTYPSSLCIVTTNSKSFNRCLLSCYVVRAVRVVTRLVSVKPSTDLSTFPRPTASPTPGLLSEQAQRISNRREWRLARPWFEAHLLAVQRQVQSEMVSCGMRVVWHRVPQPQHQTTTPTHDIRPPDVISNHANNTEPQHRL